MVIVGDEVMTAGVDARGRFRLGVSHAQVRKDIKISSSMCMTTT